MIDPKKNIFDNLVSFFKYIEKTPYKVFLNSSPLLNVFSKSDTKNVTFIVRHPVHSLSSFGKDIRHQEHIEALGGIDSERAIEFWADRWNRLTNEYLLCKDKGLNPVLIRFEYAQADAEVTKYHKKAFAGFLQNKRNWNMVESESARYLMELVEENFNRLYPEWD